MRSVVFLTLSLALLGNLWATLVSWPVGEVGDKFTSASLDCVASAIVNGEQSCPALPGLTDQIHKLSGPALAKLAQILRDAGDSGQVEEGSELSIEARMSALCAARSLYLKSVGDNPSDPGALLNWANLEQIVAGQCVGDKELGLEELKDRIVETTKFGLKQEPYSPNVLNSVAFVSLRAGDREFALPLIKRLLEYSVRPTREQEARIVRAVVDPEDLRQIIPARFPQIDRWSVLYSQQIALDRRGALADSLGGHLPGAGRVSGIARVFADLQLTALLASEQDLAVGEINAKQHLRRILGLLDKAASDEVRRAIDRSLVSLWKQGVSSDVNRAVSNYFSARADLNQLEAIYAPMPGDTRPDRRSIVGWGKQNQVAFDYYFTTIGAFLPPDAEINFIELTSQKTGAPVSLLPGQIRYYVSADNMKWDEVFPNGEPIRFTLAGLNRYVVPIKFAEGYRYLKINYGSPARDQNWVGPAGEIAKIFGQKRVGKPKMAIERVVDEDVD